MMRNKKPIAVSMFYFGAIGLIEILELFWVTPMRYMEEPRIAVEHSAKGKEKDVGATIMHLYDHLVASA
jgi:hypothetical protein